MTNRVDRLYGPGSGFIAVAFCVGVIALADYLWIVPHPVWAFLFCIGAMIAALGTIGYGINRRPAGVLIDNRNRVSLSKLQATAWTVIVIAALVTVAGHNLALLDDASLQIDIPPELLSAMGISAASFVATPLVLSLKADSTPTQKDEKAVAADLNMAPGELQNRGKVFGRSTAKAASWADIFRGEEVGNAATPDLSKVQQFFISLLLYGIYGWAIIDLLVKTSGKIYCLPPLSDRFVWLLALSHASYIAYKAAPHTEDGDADAQGDQTVRSVG